MFDVLVFVYENYWTGAACPAPDQLGRKLSANGFSDDEIRDALQWLDGLTLATQGIEVVDEETDEAAQERRATVGAGRTIDLVLPPSEGALRVYSAAEQDHLGAECLGFLCFLESAGALSGALREIIIERAMAAPSSPLSLEELKIIVLMVHWGTGIEPDALVLDELVDDPSDRRAH